MTPPATDPLPIRWPRVAAVLILGWLAFELVSQAYIYYWAGTRYQTFAKYRWSPYGLVRNNPDLTNPAFHINPNGFRNVETFTRVKPPGTLRVLMLGGSVLYSGLGGETTANVERVDSNSTIAQFLKSELERDPACHGVRVEVINAAVNFNRIPEVSTGYLNEWRFWDPDIVVVCGSANNFGYMPAKGEVPDRQFAIQTPHPWHAEFQRIANRRTGYTLGEHAVLTAEEHSGAFALAKVAVTRAIDWAFAKSATWALASPKNSLDRTDREAAPFAEYDRYVDEYLGYADAMVAAADRSGQKIAFFWEYFLGHLGGVKPFGPDEEYLYNKNRRPNYRRDAIYDWYARDRLAKFCSDHHTTLVDPLEDLKGYSGMVFIDYLHYTVEGNRLMARVIHRQLQPLFRQEANRIRASGS